MRKTFVLLVLAVSACVVASQAQADSISFSMSSRAVSATEGTPGGAPAEGRVVSFFVTTDGDILSVGNVAITDFAQGSAPKQPYQHPAGTNNAPPNDAVVIALPPLGADSYIDTPGNTSILGTDMPGDGSPNSAWGDLSDDGPKTNFKFAQLTFPKGEGWRFSGNVTIAGATAPFSAPFNFTPEPGSSALAGLGMLAVAAFRRRFAA
jgi:hypothetical protein